jgi:hypothetical protein
MNLGWETVGRSRARLTASCSATIRSARLAAFVAAKVAE